METRKATIRREERHTHLVLSGNGQNFEIILTDDNPNNVKGVFNNLLRDLKNGPFRYDLQDDTNDLYFNICKEYITQLNVELQTVFGELQDFDLLDGDQSIADA